MTAKEKVLAYFEEWGGQETNPDNGVRIWEQSKRLWNIMRDTPKGAVHLYRVMDYEDSPADDFRFEVAARILKLDTPKAAEIQWSVMTAIILGDGGAYLIKESENHPGKYIAVNKQGWDVGDQGLHDSPEAAKQACQDHKQKRLEALL